jgi:hypothetical protein
MLVNVRRCVESSTWRDLRSIYTSTSRLASRDFGKVHEFGRPRPGHGREGVSPDRLAGKHMAGRSLEVPMGMAWGLLACVMSNHNGSLRSSCDLPSGALDREKTFPTEYSAAKKWLVFSTRRCCCLLWRLPDTVTIRVALYTNAYIILISFLSLYSNQYRVKAIRCCCYKFKSHLKHTGR